MSQHTGLILAAHGSRKESSNEEVERFAQSLAVEHYDIHYVACAFLELAKPDIAEAIAAAICAGCGEIIVIPYFLAAGRHVQTDVPEIIEQCQKAHPEICIRLTPHLGASTALQGAVLKLL